MARTFKRDTRSAACSNVSVDISSTIRFIVASGDFARGGGEEGLVLAVVTAAVAIRLDSGIALRDDLLMQVNGTVVRKGRENDLRSKSRGPSK